MSTPPASTAPASTPGAQAQSLFSSGWAKKLQITINNSAQSGALTNFPLLVVLNSSRVTYSDFQGLGQDVRFLDSTGDNLLPYEIESWNTSGSSFIWVNVPSIAAASNATTIWLYYKNSSATDAQSASQVWPSPYDAVYHLNSNFLDSTGNGNNGTNSGTTGATAQIAQGRVFQSSLNAQITTSDSNHLSNFSYAAWVKGTSGPGNSKDATVIERGFNYILSWDSSSSSSYIGAALVQVGASIYAASFGSLSGGTWYLLGSTYDGTALRSYKNGNLVTTNTSPSGSASNLGGSLTLGKDNLGSDGYFDGTVDEVQISGTVFSDSWMKAKYLSETDTYCSFGASMAAP